MTIAEHIHSLKAGIPSTVTLVAVSKTHPAERVMEAYHAGQRIFGENKVQELTGKAKLLPSDIQWHLIGHLQTNKVKDIVPLVSLIHSVDSLKLLHEVNRQGLKCNRVVDVLIQAHIAEEETKFGMDFTEINHLLHSEDLRQMHHIRICGLMGMATNTTDKDQIRKEFRSLRHFFNGFTFPVCFAPVNPEPVNAILSMGMSSDYMLAIEEGTTMIRIGSTIFGAR
ncbi:MAG: YggS family pyridoxal phosphate-dependent enzyme [Bacteroidia bacterium]